MSPERLLMIVLYIAGTVGATVAEGQRKDVTPREPELVGRVVLAAVFWPVLFASHVVYKELKRP